jgi:hypothetical protein
MVARKDCTSGVLTRFAHRRCVSSIHLSLVSLAVSARDDDVPCGVCGAVCLTLSVSSAEFAVNSVSMCVEEGRADEGRLYATGGSAIRSWSTGPESYFMHEKRQGGVYGNAVAFLCTANGVQLVCSSLRLLKTALIVRWSRAIRPPTTSLLPGPPGRI